MANYCIDQNDIDEFTETFAERIGLMNWQMATQYKRQLKRLTKSKESRRLWMASTICVPQG
ncbi:MAG: hypothetical protein Ct9H90mP27_1580 [Gammaproteobacteria bacterium]|nr:MAG: hypothetical protein Ct9H90mP27_1580 [Gammaproteobacteria bacterium]